MMTDASLPLPGHAGAEALRPRRSLYELDDDFRLLEEALLEAAADEEAVALLRSFFDQLTQETEDKLDAYCSLIQEFSGRADVRLREAKRLQELGNADKHQAERMKGALLWFFQSRGLTKRETLHFRIARQQNGGHQPLRLLVEPERLPDDLRCVTYAADTSALRERLAEAADERQELELSRQLLHSLSGLDAEKLALLTSILSQLGIVEAQLNDVRYAINEADDAGGAPQSLIDRFDRLRATRDDLWAQAEAIETFSSWSDQHRQELHDLERRLAGEPWCYATLEPRGEHVRIR